MNEQQNSTTKIPWVVRRISSETGLRHTKGVAIIRWFVAAWLVFLGTLFCVRGYWWGAFLFVAAGVNGWFALVMPRWRMALLAEKNLKRVHELERSRAVVVDDAAARLRRIEQDLHDGAQAQMVAVVMKLGLAKDHLTSALSGSGTTDVERSLELVEAAHRQATEAISDLRDLAHGIHPSALGEGLGNALAALAARSDVPVELNVTLPERPSLAIETIAYFCVNELLTNVAKHSGARHVTLDATHEPDSLTLRVRDDGDGGALVEAGGGLAGLSERVSSVDGRLRVCSPIGGPTVVTIELPSHA